MGNSASTDVNIQGIDCIDINLNNMQQHVVDCVDVSPAALGGSRQCFRQYRPRLRSMLYYIISIACREPGTSRSAYRCGQVEHRLPSYEGFFVIVLNLHIDDMHNTIKFTPS
jgi:hypothetical protein